MSESEQVKPPAVGDVMAFRAYYREHVRPRVYSPVAHVVVHLGSGLLGCAWAASRVSNPSALELSILPAMVVLASLFVYWFHREVLHRPRALFRYAYQVHTLQHHRFFDYDHITPDERADLHITLFPWFAGPGLAAATAGLGYLIGPLAGQNATHLVMLVANGYLLSYEVIHSIGHLPDGHLLTRMPLLIRYVPLKTG